MRMISFIECCFTTLNKINHPYYARVLRAGAMVRLCGGEGMRWRDDAVARWYGDEVLRWCDGKVVRGGAVTRYCGGAMARWCDGKVVR